MGAIFWFNMLHLATGTVFGALMMRHYLRDRILNADDYRAMHAAQDEDFRERLRRCRPDIAALAERRRASMLPSTPRATGEG